MEDVDKIQTYVQLYSNNVELNIDVTENLMYKKFVKTLRDLSKEQLNYK